MPYVLLLVVVVAMPVALLIRKALRASSRRPGSAAKTAVSGGAAKVSFVTPAEIEVACREAPVGWPGWIFPRLGGVFERLRAAAESAARGGDMLGAAGKWFRLWRLVGWIHGVWDPRARASAGRYARCLLEAGRIGEAALAGGAAMAGSATAAKLSPASGDDSPSAGWRDREEAGFAWETVRRAAAAWEHGLVASGGGTASSAKTASAEGAASFSEGGTASSTETASAEGKASSVETMPAEGKASSGETMSMGGEASGNSEAFRGNGEAGAHVGWDALGGREALGGAGGRAAHAVSVLEAGPDGALLKILEQAMSADLLCGGAMTSAKLEESPARLKTEAARELAASDPPADEEASLLLARAVAELDGLGDGGLQDALKARDLLGRLYFVGGEPDRALAAYTDVAERLPAAVPVGPTGLAAALEGMAESLEAMGSDLLAARDKPRQAARFYVLALGLRGRVSGADSFEARRAARAIERAAKVEAAQMRGEPLERDLPEILAALSARAEMEESVGHLARALALHREVLDSREYALRSNHPDTERTRREIERLRGRLGK
ncbi:MAG: hypothetical protein LBR80_01975 [Deltaproteobacteria bacterium]|jgi:tetratricopeptide (TPR) repeat protein|nr:hypothetical protein [Deltaproteobacteria bacterium]